MCIKYVQPPHQAAVMTPLSTPGWVNPVQSAFEQRPYEISIRAIHATLVQTMGYGISKPATAGDFIWFPSRLSFFAQFQLMCM